MSNCHLIYTAKCIICGGKDITIASGHVTRETCLVGSTHDTEHINIIACFCSRKCMDAGRSKKTYHDGCYGKYKSIMGMVDEPNWKYGRGN